jgi:hypothetical protein
MIKPKGTDTPTTSTTVPARVGQTKSSDLVITTPTTVTYAGGITKDAAGVGYKPPALALFSPAAQSTAPYLYTNQDWQILLTLPKNEVIALQNAMAAAYPQQYKPANLGKANDPKTVLYFKNVLAQINTDPAIQGKTWKEGVNYLAKNPILPTTPAATALNQFKLTNPLDVKAVINATAEKTLGRKLSAEDVDRLTKTYQTMETTEGMSVGKGNAKAIMSAPSAETFTLDSLEKMYPKETNVRKFGSYIEALKGQYNL